MMKSCFGAALLALSLPLTVHSQNGVPLTLEDALRVGVANNRLLRASAAKSDAAAARASEAGAALLPSIKMQASYTRLSEVDPFQVNVPFLPAPVVISPVVLNNYALRVGLQQPVFTGFKLAGNAHAANLLAQATDADTRSDRADLVLNITGAYWALYQARQMRRVTNENVTRLESYRDDTERLLASGAATRNDKLRIDVQLASATLQRIDAENDEQVALMNLNTLLGQPLETPLLLTSEPANDDRAGGVTAVPEVSGVVTDLRPDLQAMHARVEASKEYVTAARGGWFPQLFLTGSFSYARPNPRYLPTRDEFKSTWDVGVSLQWDLWTWMTPGHQTDQAHAQLRQNELLFEQMKDNARLEVTRASLGVGRARAKIGVAASAVVQAEENVRILKDKYREGLSTSTELLDAEVALLQASTNLTGARVEYEVAFARLRKAAGTDRQG